MANEAITFEDFVKNVDLPNLAFVNDTHDFMLAHGLTYKIEAAKSGHVLSYLLPKTKKVIANYVFRKSGLFIRIYGDNIGLYPDILDVLPDGMLDSIEGAPLCKRLHDPAKCNSRCPMGYIFDLSGTTHKKCRYFGFLFPVRYENHAAIRDFLTRELNARAA